MKATTVKLVQTVDGFAVVSTTDIAHIDAFMSVRGFKQIGTKGATAPGGIKFREEIAGQPIYSALNGPMYDGPGIVRYEG